MSKAKARGNGQGSVYKDGSTWTATITLGYYLDKDGKRKRKIKRKKGFRTKTDAINYLPTLRAETESAPKRTVADLWAYWSQNGMKRLAKNTRRRMETAYAKIAELRFYDINDISVSEMQDVLNRQAPTYTPAKDIRTLFSHLFACAMADKITPTDLSQYLVLPENDETRPDPFNADEINALWRDWNDGNLYTGFILLMIYTGMMPGEVLALEKRSVKLDQKCIVGAGLKTEKRKASPIALSDAILPVVERLMAESDGDKLWQRSESKFRKSFIETLKRTGCRPNLKPYSCRHTTATVLAENETEINTIKEVMRHSNVATTSHYVHVSQQSVTEAVNSIAPLLHPDG